MGCERHLRIHSKIATECRVEPSLASLPPTSVVFRPDATVDKSRHGLVDVKQNPAMTMFSERVRFLPAGERVRPCTPVSLDQPGPASRGHRLFDVVASMRIARIRDLHARHRTEVARSSLWTNGAGQRVTLRFGPGRPHLFTDYAEFAYLPVAEVSRFLPIGRKLCCSSRIAK